MVKVKLSDIMTKGKAMFLAYDQGLEHGPESDFNGKNYDPLYILDIAKKGKFNAVIYHKGIVEKYNKEIKKSGVPLILKLNGKTKLYKGEPKSTQTATVKEAIKLGAKAVGFTIFIGSAYEEDAIEEFEVIEREAHAKGLPVIVWVYPRGKSVKDPTSRESITYAARTGLELGADIVKIHWNGKLPDLKRCVDVAGRTKVVVAGGMKKSGKDFLKSIETVRKSGAAGLAVGRNIWQDENPIELSKKVRKVLFSGDKK